MFINEKKFYNFCKPVMKITMMLRRITLLQLASMCCVITQKPLLVRCIANVRPTTILQLLNHGPMLDRCQKANNDVLPTTPRCGMGTDFSCFFFCVSRLSVHSDGLFVLLDLTNIIEMESGEKKKS